MSDKRDALIWSIALLLLAFFLRIFRLGYQPMWSDEIYSVAVARHSLPEVVGWVYRDNHPALYWLILYPVAHFLGDSEFLIRFPSAVMGTLTVALVYTAGRQIFEDRQVGLLAALWLAFSPFHVVYSQEARMYASLSLFGFASILFLYRGVFRKGRLNWLLFGLTAAATAHSHNYGLLLVAAQGLWGLGLLLWTREAALFWGLALGLGVFVGLYAPMVHPLLIQMRMSVGSTGVATLNSIKNLIEAFGSGFAGFSTPGLTPSQLLEMTAPPAAVVTMLLAAFGLLVGPKGSVVRDNGWANSPSFWTSLLLGICFLFPILFVYGYSSWLHSAVWQVRGFQMALGCFALAVGVGLARLRPHMLRWGICLGLIAVASINLYPHYFERYKSTVPDAVKALEGQLSAKDVLFAAPYWNWTPFRYYYRGEADAIGGWKQGGKFQFMGVGTDYADLIDSRSLNIQLSVRDPIVPPSEFRPEDYDRVWTISHWATPQRVTEMFGDDVSVMHYDAETRRWRTVVYPPSTSASDLSLANEVDLRWENGLRLLGYAWQAPPVVGQEARLTLFWKADRVQETPSRLKVRFIDPDGRVALEESFSMISLMHGIPMVALGIRSNFPTTMWSVGSVVVQQVEMELPPDLPPLSYQLVAQVRDRVRGESVSIAGDRWTTLDRISVSRPSEPYGSRAVTFDHCTNVSFDGKIRLLGYSLPEASPKPGHSLPIWFNWSAITSSGTDYEVQVRLLDRDGAVLAETAGFPSVPAFPTSKWETGDLIQGKMVIPLPPEMEGGQYRLAIRLVDAETQEPLLGRRSWGMHSREWIVIGRAEVASWPFVTDPPSMEYRSEGLFGDAVRLLGYDLEERLDSEAEMSLTLYWRVETPLKGSYLVFVHLIDETGEVIAQADGIPVDWMRPTTTWREGEVIADRYELSLPAELPQGTYELYVGFYHPEGQRLPVVVDGESVPGRRLSLGSVSFNDKQGDR